MDYNEFSESMRQIQAENNAWNAKQVEQQMNFQKMMSDTAHQREVADLKKAGLNPVLSAGGSGAASMQGAAAQSDSSLVSTLGSLAQTLASAENSKAIAEMNNSAAMLRQQQSDAAAMDRLLLQIEANNKRTGSAGYGNSSGSGLNRDPNSGSGFLEFGQGFFDSLPDKGSSRLFGITLPNSTWKWLYAKFGDAIEKIVPGMSFDEIMALVTGSKGSDSKSDPSVENLVKRGEILKHATGDIKRDLDAGVIDAVTSAAPDSTKVAAAITKATKTGSSSVAYTAARGLVDALASVFGNETSTSSKKSTTKKNSSSLKKNVSKVRR